MEKLIAYKRMPCGMNRPCLKQFSKSTIQSRHGENYCLEGLKFIELTEDSEVLLSTSEAGADNPMAQLQAWHKVEAALKM